MSNKIIDRVKRIGKPDNYLEGCRSENYFCADNILTFFRDNGKHLLTSTRKYDHHHRYVLIIALKGSGRIGVGDNIINVIPESALLIFPHQIHYYPQVEENISWLYITFECKDPSKILSLKNSFRKLPQDIYNYINSYLDAYDQIQNSFTKFSELSYKLSLIIQKLLDSDRLEDSSADSSDLINQVTDYINSNIQSDNLIEQMAGHFSLSKNYLSALFRDNFSVTLGQYILAFRINKATEMLIKSDCQISLIAKECGFASLYNFGRAFKRNMRVTPREYRNRWSVI